MDTNVETEGEYVAALTERDREIYNRAYNVGILARSRIFFDAGADDDPRTYFDDETYRAAIANAGADDDSIPDGDPRTHRGAGTDTYPSPAVFTDRDLHG